MKVSELFHALARMDGDAEVWAIVGGTNIPIAGLSQNYGVLILDTNTVVHHGHIEVRSQ